MAAGDLTVRTHPDGQDEAAQLLREMNHMSEHLATLVGHVRTAADSIATGSQEIATGNADLSQRTELQASALQQTAASMEQLGTTVRHNADSAREASQLATSASDTCLTLPSAIRLNMPQPPRIAASRNHNSAASPTRPIFTATYR